MGGIPRLRLRDTSTRGYRKHSFRKKREGCNTFGPGCSARFAFNKDEGRAVQAYEKMLEEGIAPDNRTLSNLIIAYSWGDLEEMRRWVRPPHELCACLACQPVTM